MRVSKEQFAAKYAKVHGYTDLNEAFGRIVGKNVYQNIEDTGFILFDRQTLEQIAAILKRMPLQAEKECREVEELLKEPKA